MKKITSKSQLAIVLSGLKGFNNPKVSQEQYLMDGEIGASMLWNSYLLGDLNSKVIADLGCGTGILGIGALLLGAKKAISIDSDKNVLKIAKYNILKVKSEGYNIGDFTTICSNVKKINLKADLVVENPPFGTKMRHNDRMFLEKALEIAPVVYSFHKSETKVFLERFSAKKNARITHIWDYKFPLKATFDFHSRQIHYINVSCFRIERAGQILSSVN
ncbi:50S ribosomal protein L11 methyltransferase [Candidatus Woesearchaeota archaeon]|nr:50S ribosomal protein L11 methyltransferase [Candidatus Woesearchaeota archaeon]